MSADLDPESQVKTALEMRRSITHNMQGQEQESWALNRLAIALTSIDTMKTFKWDILATKIRPSFTSLEGLDIAVGFSDISEGEVQALFEQIRRMFDFIPVLKLQYDPIGLNPAYLVPEMFFTA